MRAIDADELLKLIPPEEVCSRFAVKNAPTIEPQRKTGKWIERDDGWDGVYYECSVCKEPFTLIDGTPSENLYNYCPNCGSDMRGEDDDIPIEYFESGGI